MSEKTYINGVFIKESKYGLKVSIKAETFCEQIKSLANDKGYVNIEIKKRKELDKNNNTHYAELDTWKPELKTETQKEPSQEQVNKETDLPF